MTEIEKKILEKLTFIEEEMLTGKEINLLFKEISEVKNIATDNKKIGTRSESKLSHGFEKIGINITNKPKEEFVVDKLFIQNNGKECLIRALHKDVTIGDLIEYLDDKFGEFKFVCGETEWIITK